MKRMRLVLLLALLLAACDTIGDDDPMMPPEEPGLVTFHAHFPEPNEQHVALAPFDDPTQYRFVSEGGRAACSRLSRDQSKLVYFDAHDGGRMLLYDIEQDTTIHLKGALKEAGHPSIFGIFLNQCTLIWDDEGTRFFFGNEAGIAGGKSVFSYRLGDSIAVRVKDSALPIDYIGRDTLIVEAVRGEPRRVSFFLMDARTGVLSPLANPHLDPYSTTIVLAWNEARRRFVASVRGAAPRRARLVLTNLDGSFFQVLTEEGPYRDLFPRWGPHGTVLFNRIAEDVRDNRACGSVMIADTETGEVRAYLRPEAVEGAPHLCHPDY